jgi:GH35 family endo-1,4-beta-xylanase
MREIDRRKFLGGLAAIAGTSIVGCRSPKQEETTVTLPPTTQDLAGLGMEEADAPVMSDGRPAVRMILTEADGSPIETEKMRTLHARDLNNDPLPQGIATAQGRARLELANEPIQIIMRLKVPGFGEVYCFADNDGRGYTRAQNREFVVDCAQTRLRRVRETWETLKSTGLEMGRDFHDRLAAASRPIPKEKGTARIATAYESLAHGLHAGEQLALANAKHRIARLAKPREDFKFGVMVSGFDSLGPEYEKRVRELFDFATVGWYWWNDEAKANAGDFVNYQRMDASVQWCLDRKITPKNFGYLYMARGATPEWIRPIEAPAATRQASSRPAADLPRGPVNTLPNSEPSNAKREFNPKWPYDRVKKTYEQVIRQTMQRFHGRCPVAEIMNEAHDKANLWGLNHDQILDFARMAFRAAREGSPTVQRMMNHCCMWGEYAKNRNADGSRRWSPHQFIKTCFDNGIDYEVIGLQLYYPQHDVFEIDRMLDRFNEFNKPIHITEIATASQDGLDPESMRPKTYAPGWHGPWSPTLQADWAEAMWTLLYSKPNYQVVGWWDFVDVKGHFWPFGGLLQKDLQPKEAYHRLLKLKQSWGLAKAT